MTMLWPLFCGPTVVTLTGFHCISESYTFFHFFVPLQTFYVGKFVLTAYSKRGIGGATQFKFTYCGCWKVEIDHKCSQITLESGRHLQLLALFLTFFYLWERICWLSENIREGVGIKCNFRENFSEVIDLALPYIIHFLDGMCDGATLQWNRSYQIKLVAGPELWYVVMIAGL